MRKLRLDMDALQVQSFATDDAGAFPFGTVHGRQKENTGVEDIKCSALVPCESALGCSEANPCRPTRNERCPSADAACPSAAVGACPEEPSAVDACPSGRGCTQVAGCDPPPDTGCPGEWSKLSCPE